MSQSRRSFLKSTTMLGSALTLAAGSVSAKEPVAPKSSNEQQNSEPIFIGDDRILFLDEALIARSKNVRLKMHEPTRCHEKLVFDKPWEGNHCNYGSVLYDPNDQTYRMYYLGAGSMEGKHECCTCYMRSKDGINWERPEFDHPFGDCERTNIILEGMEDFNPFIDPNPACKPEERYKAVSSANGAGIRLWSSPDGEQWTLMADGANVFSEGAFDSQNTAVWSEKEQCYFLYFRLPRNDARDVGIATSPDFIHWTSRGHIEFPVEGEGPSMLAQYYTNQLQYYYRAPRYLLGFPARYVNRGYTNSTFLLPEQEERAHRGTFQSRFATATTDSVYIVSRDGWTFRQSPDVFLKPGLKTAHNWSYGDNYIARGLLETNSTFDDEPRQLTLYATESRFTGNDTFWRRYTMRLDGFASMAAASKRGFFETKPFIFQGTELSINASTSAFGWIRIALCTPDGKPYPGYSAEDCDLIYGDSTDRRVTWQNEFHVPGLQNKPVIMRVRMMEADIYSFKFTYGHSTVKREGEKAFPWEPNPKK